jgi:hypothetical protein
VILALQGQPEKAARLFGAIAEARAMLGTQMSVGEARDYESNLAVVRAQLDDVAFTTAWEEGQLMTLEEAATCALEEVAQV